MRLLNIILVVSCICLCLGSAEATAKSSLVVPSAPSNLLACTGVTNIIVNPQVDTYITICGNNFGASTDVVAVEVDIAGGFKADIVGQTDNQLIIKLPSDGAGQNLNVKVVLGEFTSIVPDLWVSYAQPMVTGAWVEPSSKRSNTQNVVVTGINFQDPSPLVHVSITIGSFPCTHVQHVSNTLLKCSVSGYGSNLQVIVTVNGQTSAPTATTVGASAVRFDFPDPTVPGLECVPPYGSPDALSPEYCNCWSGAAAADTVTFTDCSIHAVCAGRITTQPQISQVAPSRPDTTFKDDKLWIKQTVAIVKNRRDTIIQFVVPNLGIDPVNPSTIPGTVSPATCSYPGNLWAKKINNLDCMDEFYGSLPWSQHEMCGFVEDTSAAITASLLRVFKSNLVTTYTETFKKSDGSVYFRKISNSFLVSVSFARQIVVLTKTPVTVYIADENAPTSISIIVNGDALYDVATKNTIIIFETTMVWPYQIADNTLSGWWQPSVGNVPAGPIVASAELAPIQPGEYECDQTEDTTCEQSWILTIQTQPGSDHQVCNLRGTVTFNTASLVCRDYTTVAACKDSPNTNFTISIGNTDLCDSAPAIDASAGLHTDLETYYDADYEIPQAIFQTGDNVFFKLIVTDPLSTIDQITFKEIIVRSSTDTTIPEDQLYMLPVSGGPIATATVLPAVDFNITQEFRTPFLTPGATGVLGFNFRLVRKNLSVVSSLSAQNSDSMTKQLTVEATIDILYHGNQKRTFVATSQVPALSHTQISFYDMGDTNEELEPHVVPATDDEAASSLFVSPAATVVASCLATVATAAVLLA